MNEQKKILFVCLGNICRSPAAEGILQSKLKLEGLEDRIFCDSAGTSAYHAGEPADARMRQHARQRGYELQSLARQFTPDDFKNFDYILTMDASNYRNVSQLKPAGDIKAKLAPLTSYCKIHKVEEVPDPYHGGDEGFELVLDILEDSCAELLLSLKKDL